MRPCPLTSRMPESVSTPEAHELFEMMVAFLQATHRAAERAMQGRNISPAQFFVLQLVTSRGPLDQRSITVATGGTAGNTSQLVAKLEAGGLLNRTISGRRKLVAATDRGAALVRRLRPKHDAFLQAQFAPLGKPARRALASALRTLLSNARD